MAVAFTHLSWWLWSGKHQEPTISKGASLNVSSDSNMWELDVLRFPLVNGRNGASSRRIKSKRKSREERKIDPEYDMELVPSDGGCVSGSESDDSDWSIGWLEPHGPGFQSDDDLEDSFAVLVPCYGHGQMHMEEIQKEKFLNAVENFPEMYASEGKQIEGWLSSLLNS